MPHRGIYGSNLPETDHSWHDFAKRFFKEQMPPTTKPTKLNKSDALGSGTATKLPRISPAGFADVVNI